MLVSGIPQGDAYKREREIMAKAKKKPTNKKRWKYDRGSKGK
jgi:hypothetical protein